MKYIKLFENLPQIGEYAIVEPSIDRKGLSQEWRDFLKCHVGKIFSKRYYTYGIEFETVASFSQTINFRIDEIIEHSKNREDLEYIETAKKYNL
jgi:hypothetical protein